MGPSSSLRRLTHIFAVILRHALAYLLTEHLVRRLTVASRLGVRRLSGPERFRTAIEDVGGVFIKFGQMLALQPDLLSLEYCNALFNLLDRVAPFCFEEVERTFVEELGRKPAEIFERFDPQPIATASIGQVHLARLKGRKLAVKVQRPNVETDFAGDIRLMAATIRLIQHLHLRALYWMIEPMSEFLAWTREELDYRKEARYMQRLRDNAKDNTRETVPEVLWDYTTRRILAAEFLEGETVLAYLRALERGDTAMLDRLDADGLDSHEVASNIIDNFLGDVFRHGMYHADLHPANLMILPENVVGYIDFGITGTISRYSRQNLVALTLAYTRGDLKGMCDAFFSVSAMDINSDAERFQEGLKRAAETWYETEGKERRLRKNFTLVMLDMLQLSRRTGIWPERDVIKYIRSAIAIDGLITRFAPTFDVGRHLEMVCDRYLRWQVRHALFDYSALVSFVGATSNMVHDGPLRLGRFFQRTATGQMSAWADVEGAHGPSDRSLQRKSTQLAAIIFIVSSIIAFTGVQVRLGVNLFTVETVFLACAAITLLQTIRRLKKEGRINHA